jgi:hypothetical protein
MINLEGVSFHASVHKELLCYYSPYYTTLLKSSKVKKDTISLDLWKTHAHALVCWLYTGTLPGTGDDLDDLMQLYCFADETEMLALRRSIMSRIIESETLDPEELTKYLRALPENSGLFRYLVDKWAVVWNQPYYADMSNFDEHEAIPRGFLYKALEKLANMIEDKDKGTTAATLAVVCNYHEHSNVSEWNASILSSRLDLPTPVPMLTQEACYCDDHSCERPADDYFKEG